ncbi:MAG: hypothetical protein JW963_06415 [Anaerolineales bacterium]|nr:hypothetical protein [Anaerolineales bacterium]
MSIITDYLSQASSSDRRHLRQINNTAIARLTTLHDELLASDDAKAISDSDLLVDHIIGHLRVALDNAQRLEHYFKHNSNK